MFSQLQVRNMKLQVYNINDSVFIVMNKNELRFKSTC